MERKVRRKEGEMKGRSQEFMVRTKESKRKRLAKRKDGKRKGCSKKKN